MPNINLLPWREERRKELKNEFFAIPATQEEILVTIKVHVSAVALSMIVPSERPYLFSVFQNRHMLQNLSGYF